ncbi:MAG TPA: MobF family relaxase, partial [Mycobacteriales bacterium]|nr:MobF family relaxase [Mycobacteriales bacterium]
LGDGARAAGLTGALDDAGERALRALLNGCGAGGDQLVAPVLRADPRRRLPAERLIRALETTGMATADLPAATTLEAAKRRLAEQDATLDIDVVRRVAAAVGLDPTGLYRDTDGRDRYGEALDHAGARVDIRRAGLDVTVSAPKSVSVLYGLSDPDTASQVRDAHNMAVGEVVAYLQRHAATAARGHHGDGRTVPRITTDGLIVAAFDHRSSRAGDPQLHTHLVIPNLVRGSDGRWSAMDTAAIYRHARTASSIYHAVLRGELTRRLGVGWTPVQQGIAEIEAMPPGALAVFAKRSAQIKQAMANRGTTGAKAAQTACLDTRPAKRRGGAEGLRDRWRAEAAAHGVADKTIANLLSRVAPPGPPDLDLLAAGLFGSEGLTASQTSFTRQDLARAVCDEYAGTPVTLADLDRVVLELLDRDEVVPVISGSPRERRYTTIELLTIERATLTLATTTPTEPAAVVHPMIVATAFDSTGLSAEQTAAVRELVSSGRRVDVLAGPAGSGKTAALAATHQLWAAARKPVIGASLSWLAAGELEAATGIPSHSLTKTLHDADRHGLPPGVVLVLDEAGLVDTRTLHRLLAHVAAADGKLVTVGDPHQLPEIGAGGIFATLAAQPAAIHLTSNQRQRETWEQEALRTLRDGDPVTALDAYRRHGRIHTAPNKPELLEQIAGDYQRAATSGDDVLVLAARRSDVSRLNQTIHQQQVDTGALGDDELTITTSAGQRAFRTGDRIIVAMNDRDHGLTNGQRGTVADVDVRRARAVLAFDDGHQVTVDQPMMAAGAIDLGYATTMHKAQGLTVDTTLVYGLGPITREHGYVALSRGRNENHIYLAADTTYEPECGPPVDSPERTAAALTAELVERLRDSRVQRLASQQLPATRPRSPYDEDLYRQQIYPQPDRGRSLGR